MWISTAEALQICKDESGGNPPAFTTDPGIRDAGIRGGWARKSKDGYHWEFNKFRLVAFLRGYGETVPSLSKKTGRPKWAIYYAMLKLGIHLERKNGKRFIKDKDAARIVAEFNSGARDV